MLLLLYKLVGYQLSLGVLNILYYRSIMKLTYRIHSSVSFILQKTRTAVVKLGKKF